MTHAIASGAAAARWRGVAVLALLATAILSMPARAASVTYELTQSNVNAGSLADGADFAQVTISNPSPGTLTFTVSLLSPLTSIAGSNFGIQDFGFNVSGSSPLRSYGIVSGQWTLPTGWGATVNPVNSLSSFGTFGVEVDATGANRASPLVFSLHNTGLTLASFADTGSSGFYFALHVAGFSTSVNGSTVTSAWFGGNTPAPVPVPAAAWLLLSGLGGVGLVARRRRGGASDA